MSIKQRKKLRATLAVVLSIVGIFTMAVCVVTSTQATLAATEIVWNGERDRALAVDIAAVQNMTRKNASGTKITSNAHSADFPGIYFIWDSKQKDNGYLKVHAGVFDAYESFTLTAKESKTYWDFAIAPQSGQAKTDDGCYVFFIPKVYGKKNINMVFIGEAAAVVPITTTTATTTTTTTTTAPVTTVTTTAAPRNPGIVITGSWTIWGNNIASVDGNGFSGEFDSPVVAAGLKYAYEDASLDSASTLVAAVLASPFSSMLMGLKSGTWYFAAYVELADGTVVLGEMKSAVY